MENSQKMRKLISRALLPLSAFVICFHAMCSSNRSKDRAKPSMFFLCDSLSRNYFADKKCQYYFKSYMKGKEMIKQNGDDLHQTRKWILPQSWVSTGQSRIQIFGGMGMG